MESSGGAAEEGWTTVVKRDKRFRDRQVEGWYGIEQVEGLVEQMRDKRVYLQMQRGLRGVNVHFDDPKSTSGARAVLPVSFHYGLARVDGLESKQWFFSDRNTTVKHGPDVDISYWVNRMQTKRVWLRVATGFRGLEMFDDFPERMDRRTVVTARFDLVGATLVRDDNGEEVFIRLVN